MGSAQLLTYKQAIKYPVGTVFKYKEAALLTVGQGNLLVFISTDGIVPVGNTALPSIWDTPEPLFTLAAKTVEPTVAEVCAERGWTSGPSNMGYHFYPDDRKYYTGTFELPASKVARIIDIIEEK